jgi:ferredoxin
VKRLFRTGLCVVAAACSLLGPATFVQAQEQQQQVYDEADAIIVCYYVGNNNYNCYYEWPDGYSKFSHREQRHNI